MYINPFVAGVIVTIIVEILIIVAIGLINISKGDK